MAIAPNALPPSRSLPPPKIAPHIAMRATNVMPSATAAATELMRMSRFSTCDSSCASTPRSSSRSSTCRIPCVTHTAAWCGLRPVANALGCVGGRHVELGHRHAGPLRELLDDGVDLGQLLAGDGLGAGGLDREGVAEPVGAADEHQADGEPDHEPGAAADGAADEHEQGAEARRAGRPSSLRFAFVFHLLGPGDGPDVGATLRAGRVPGQPLRTLLARDGASRASGAEERRLTSRSSRCGSRRRGRPRSGTSRRCGGRPRWRGAARSRSCAGPTPTPA